MPDALAAAEKPRQATNLVDRAYGRLAEGFIAAARLAWNPAAAQQRPPMTSPDRAEHARTTTRRRLPSGRARLVPRLLEVTAAGWSLGENVAVAVIVSDADATGTGEARALIDLNDLPKASTPEVIMRGRISGVVAVRRLA